MPPALGKDPVHGRRIGATLLVGDEAGRDLFLRILGGQGSRVLCCRRLQVGPGLLLNHVGRDTGRLGERLGSARSRR